MRAEAGQARPGDDLGIPTFVPALARRDRIAVAVACALWFVLLVNFWVWWLEPAHLASVAGMVVNSLLLIYVALLPSVFVGAVLGLRRVNPALPTFVERVAFVVTKAPSEPWPMVRLNLRAMLDQDHPHPYDVWLCDEDPSDETVAWCAERGVRVSTRRGKQDYHRDTWPRRTKCKEGNLAHFYDHWGYRDYDVVVQLDADHVPTRTYLKEMVRPFTDPSIGYVAAPSVCDSNAADSWAARGRLYKEATLHGPMQAGANGGGAPLCIGSHYAVRTRALRDIGGIGPELAEDFSTTFLLNGAGWHGAFALDAEAYGEGPPTFPAMLVQEFQWSRSLTVVMLDLAPTVLRKLPHRLRLRFGFALAFYPLLFFTTMLGVLLPPIAAVTGAPWVQVDYFAFVLRWFAVSLPLLWITLLLRRRGILRPRETKVVGWELWLFGLARWPYVARGVLAGIMTSIRPRTVHFKVTPKDGGLVPLPARLLFPYAAITVVASAAAVLGRYHPATKGYVLLSLLSALAYTVVGAATSMLHARESSRSGGSAPAAVWDLVKGAVGIATVQVAVFVASVVVVLTAWRG